MNATEIINLILAILTILGIILSFYFKTKEKVLNAINGKIDEAEDSGQTGAEKMAYVVDEVYSLVPVAYRGIFNKDFLKKLVQRIFDNVENYAKKQAEKYKK